MNPPEPLSFPPSNYISSPVLWLSLAPQKLLKTTPKHVHQFEISLKLNHQTPLQTSIGTQIGHIIGVGVKAFSKSSPHSKG